MPHLKNEIKQYIDDILKLMPCKKSDIEKIISDPLIRCEITPFIFDDYKDKNFLEIGLRKNYYDGIYRKGWPIFAKFKYTFMKTQEELIEKILDIGLILRDVQDERSWMIHKILNEHKEKFEDLFQHVKINSIIIKREDGSLVDTNSVEYYAALSFIHETFLKDDLFYFSAFILFDLFDIFNHYLRIAFDQLFIDGLSEKPTNRIVSRFNDPKTGVQFFGTDSRSIDFSLSAHKDNFNNGQTEAKSLERYCSINEDPKELLYWLKRYQLRPTYTPWQNALHYVDPFAWL
ncbi:MAG: hypothetical protein CNLJKLNK_00320 [Holosporales bacterium]